MRHHTCGLIIVDWDKNILAGLPYGGIFKHNGLSFPKGIAEENESYVDAAIRETYEETGLEIFDEERKKINPIDPVKYKKDKMLHLHLLYLNWSLEHYNFRCTSYIDNDPNKPEIIEFYLLPFKKIIHLLNPKQANILKKVLS